MQILLGEYLEDPKKYGPNVLAKYDNHFRKILRIGTSDGLTISLTIFDPYFGERPITAPRGLPVYVGTEVIKHGLS